MADYHRRHPRHEPHREPRRENFYSLDRDYRDHGTRRPRARSPDYKRSKSLGPYSRHHEPPRSSARDMHRRRNYSPSPDRRHHRHSTPSPQYPSSNRHPDRHSRRYDSPPLKHSPRRSSEHKEQRRAKSVPHKDERLGQAAKAALDAAAIEAIRVRHHPGPWAGSKGARVATAAVGAAITDRVMDRDPEERSTRHMVQSAIGGLAATRLLNGARKNKKRR